MDHQIAITLGITLASMGLFAWNIVPAAVVAIVTALALYFAGILTMAQTLSGFGDPVVILIAALLVIAVALETAGVGAWAGQLLLRRTGGSDALLVIAIMIVAAVFSALIGMNGAVAAMLPVVVVVSIRSGMAPSRLMIPLAFACLKGASLTLLGSPVNLIAATEASDRGYGHIGFFAWSIFGIPQVLGTIAVVALFGRYLLPERQSKAIPIDLSGHAQTLAHQYRLQMDPEELLTREQGVAEVVVPQRSALIGQTVFPGMASELGELVILAVQRGAADLPGGAGLQGAGSGLRERSVTLQAGDHLLMQGAWSALDTQLTGGDLLAIDTPEAVRKQAVPLGKGAPQALAILALLIVLLVFDIMPAPIAAVLCAALMIVTGVLTVPQAYRGIDWNTVILVGAMIAPAVALTDTGAARWIADQVVNAIGGAGSHVVLAGLFLVAAVISQAISNTSTALVMMPIAIATAHQLDVSPLPMMLGAASGASASFLTPFSNGVTLMVYGPGGYRFGDFWRLGVPVLIWTMLVTVFIVPLYWTF